jgi:hypothetical protein
MKSTVKEEIRHCSSQYSARLNVHPNDLVVNLRRNPKKALAKTLAKRSACKILGLIVFVVGLDFNVQFASFIANSR